MLIINSLEDIATMRESMDIECKLALGRSGKGALPKDFWPTYSAFANTSGGDIFLGLKENKDRSFELIGVADTSKVIDELVTNAANPEKVSCNLVSNRSITVLVIEGRQIIQVHIPKASRKQRPVYLNRNPLSNTYRRMSTGDMHQSEALVNALVHADYTGRTSVLIIKRPAMFSFRNPGDMRVPLEDAIEGSISDCRNRNLQKMFTAIGLGENAGSGLPKIFDGWQSQHWREPRLSENTELDYTLLDLHMLSLVPDHILSDLRKLYGEAVFDTLTQTERVILVTAYIENTITHSRMKSILEVHPSDLTKLFSSLVERRLIGQEGVGKGTVYFLPIARFMDELTDIEAALGNWVKSPDISSGGSVNSSGGLQEIATSVSKSKKTSRDEMQRVILELCAHEELGLDQLERLLNKSGEYLRKSHLQSLIKSKRLQLKYPTKPNHPQQAYITIREKNEK